MAITPTIPVALASAALGQAGSGGAPALVAQVLAAEAAGGVSGSLLDTLLTALKPGSILSGIVTDLSPDGTFTLKTADGASVTLHHPPEQPLTAGSSVVLRLIQNTGTPLAAFLSVNGRPVVARPAAPLPATPAAPTATEASIPEEPAAVFFTQASPPAPGAAAAYTAVPHGNLSLDDELAIGTAMSEPATPQPAAGPNTPPSASAVAILVRAAPVKPGAVPVPVGTRYQVVVTLSETAPASAPIAAAPPTAAAPAPPSAAATPGPPPQPQAAVSSASSLPPAPTAPASPPIAATQAPILASATPQSPAPVPVTAPPVAAAPPAPAPAASAPATPPASSDGPAPATPAPTTAITTPPGQATAPSPSATAAPTPEPGFIPQIFVVTGRVTSAKPGGDSLIETPLGTLSLTLPDKPAITGQAAILRITAVAPPASPAAASAGTAPHEAPRTLLDQVVETLAPLSPSLANQVQMTATVPADARLAAAIFSFLAGIKPGDAPRPAPAEIRRALTDAGRSDLAERLDSDIREIGTTRAPTSPDGWQVTTLPYLGLASVTPMRLYRKRGGDAETGEQAKSKGGDRFVLELNLKRLGPVQFDGLLREQRFDLVLRSSAMLDPGLRQLIDGVFNDTLTISGWSGSLTYSKAGRFPMLSLPPPDLGHAGIEA